MSFVMRNPRIADRPPIVLIACSASKAAEPVEARKLYLGDLFQKSVAWAESKGLTWAVISAEHGLVMPDDVIAPYNTRLDTSRKSLPQRQHWAWRIALDLFERYGRAEKVILLAGNAYRETLAPELRKRGRPVEEPLEGKGIGQQKQWLMQQMQA